MPLILLLKGLCLGLQLLTRLPACWKAAEKSPLCIYTRRMQLHLGKPPVWIPFSYVIVFSCLSVNVCIFTQKPCINKTWLSPREFSEHLYGGPDGLITTPPSTDVIDGFRLSICPHTGGHRAPVWHLFSWFTPVHHIFPVWWQSHAVTLIQMLQMTVVCPVYALCCCFSSSSFRC